MVRPLAPVLAAVALAPVVVLGGVAAVSVTRVGRADATHCTPGGGGTEGGPVSAGLTPEQREIATAIVAIGKRRGLPPAAWRIAIQAGKVESGLRNPHRGDADSQGVFQMRPSMGWGSVEQITDVAYAVNKFYDVLVAVPKWEEMAPGDAAQAVERSAFADRYATWDKFGADLVAELSGTAPGCPAGARAGAGPVAVTRDGATVTLPPQAGVAGVLKFGDEKAATVAAAALSWLGTPYAWGGGNENGPSKGIRDGGVADAHGDYGKTGFDCSGLTRHAYAAVGVTLPRVAQEQQASGTASSWPATTPGDLLFWGQQAHHVAIYLGKIGDKDFMVEAPQSGDVVKISPVRVGGDFQTTTRHII